MISATPARSTHPSCVCALRCIGASVLPRKTDCQTHSTSRDICIMCFVEDTQMACQRRIREYTKDNHTPDFRFESLIPRSTRVVLGALSYSPLKICLMFDVTALHSLYKFKSLRVLPLHHRLLFDIPSSC
jgi:hypothetical protein